MVLSIARLGELIIVAILFALLPFALFLDLLVLFIRTATGRLA